MKEIVIILPTLTGTPLLYSIAKRHLNKYFDAR